MRNVQKSLLFALLEPKDILKNLQDKNELTEVMVLQEELKTAPFGEVWSEYLKRQNIPSNYINEVKKYETEVLNKR